MYTHVAVAFILSIVETSNLSAMVFVLVYAMACLRVRALEPDRFTST